MDFLFKQALAPFLECADFWFSFEDTINIDNLDHFACKKKKRRKILRLWNTASFVVKSGYQIKA